MTEPSSEVKVRYWSRFVYRHRRLLEAVDREQSDQIQTLRGTEQFKKADAEGELLRLPTGDGGALVFRNSLADRAIAATPIEKDALDGPIAIEDSRAGGRPNRGTRPRHRCFTESSLDTGQWRTCRKTCRSLLS